MRVTRLLKQLLYGLFYAVCLGAFALLVYFFFFSAPASCIDNIKNQREEAVDCGGQCIPCAIKRLTPINVLPVQLFEAPGGKTTVFLQIQNSNTEYGVETLSYTLYIYGRGQKILGSVDGEMSINAGVTARVVSPAIDVPFTDVINSRVMLGSYTWVLEKEVTAVGVTVRGITTKVSNGKVMVEGIVENASPNSISDIVVSVLLKNRRGLLLNGTRTTIDNILPFDNTKLALVIPLTIDEVRDIDERGTVAFGVGRR